MVAKSPPSNVVLPGPPGNSVSPLNRIGLPATLKQIEPSRVAGGVDGVQADPAHLDDLLVVEEDVVADVLQAGGVEGGDRHLVAGLPHGRHGLDVVPVAVGLEDAPHVERLRQLEELLVLVGGVEQHRVAGLPAAQDEHVVLVGADDELVDLDLLVLVVQRHAVQSGTGFAERDVLPSGRRRSPRRSRRRRRVRLRVSLRDDAVSAKV